ncbi:hypothetical protein DFH09DRAFT_978574 [Mycena vulgaris]|nr:hypothetical protein DFH09DRAFT_978574 [Mycena vulgaris]
MPDLGVCVLSLDGGGAGALTQLLILENIMYRIKIAGGLDAMPSPCDYFKVIGGSGTGGIAALMLGRLRMTITEAKSAFENLRPQSKIGSAEKFQAKSFEKALRDIFREATMKDDHPNACKTFVCAMNTMNLNASIPEIFCSYNTPEQAASKCLLWELARATSAIPGLFKPMEIILQGIKQLYVGGSLVHNNPTSLVLNQANLMYPAQPVVLVVSVGSGHADTIHIPSSNAIPRALENIVMDSERSHEDNAYRFRALPNTYYVRLNVQQGLQGLGPYPWKESSKVLAHTRNYLEMQDTKVKLGKLVKVLWNPVIPDSHVYLKVCPPPTVRFTGREAILQQMAEYFSKDIGRRHIFLLYGLGGAGKSQIAFKFIEQSATPEPRFSDVYFVDSSSQQTIESDLVTMALVKKLGKNFQHSLNWLSGQQTNWLLVFNNADDTHLNLGQYFPAGPHGNIIITSRNPDLSQHAPTKCRVDQMEVEEAINLLLSHAEHDTHDPGNRTIGKQLVEKLHCFPLAVAQAGAYISTSRSLQAYLAFYDTKRTQLLSERPLQSDYGSVYTTWKISFDRLSDRARQLLQLCSFIHHDGITEEIFGMAASYDFREDMPTAAELRDPLEFLAAFSETQLHEWDSMKFIALTNELRRYSLIEFQTTSKSITFSIHPLVHEWCRTTLDLAAPTELCMHRLIGMSIAAARDYYPFIHQIFPHLDALLFVNTVQSSRKPYLKDTMFASQCLDVYDCEGKYADGVELGSLMLQSGSKKWSELKTLGVQEKLASLYKGAGMHYLAEELQESVSNKYSEILGDDDTATLRSMRQLTSTYAKRGKYRRAEELQTVILNKNICLLGDDHPETIRCMSELTWTCIQLGEFQRAKELGMKAFKKCTTILGEDHPTTISGMSNLAVAYRKLGEWQHSKELGIRALEKSIKNHGEDHPNTLLCMSTLAWTYTELGELQLSKELGNRTLEKRMEILGQDHPDTLASMANLAATCSKLGELTRAEELQSAVLQQRINTLGEDHLDTLRCMANLALTYSRLGDFMQAEELEITVLKKRTEVLGEDHPSTLISMIHLGYRYFKLRKLRQAEELQTTALDKTIQILGEDHPLTLEAMSDLALTYSATGRLSRAEELGTKALTKYMKVLGEQHPHTQECKANLERCRADKLEHTQGGQDAIDSDGVSEEQSDIEVNFFVV